MTFSESAEAYITNKTPGWRNVKTGPQWRSSLRTYAYPTIGNLNIADVTTTHILEVLKPIWNTKNETASRVRGRIEQVWNAAKIIGQVKGQNPAAWRGHLEHALPSRNSVQKVRHFPALNFNEVGKFMTALRSRPAISARALEFLILTATRTSETLQATWDEIDGGVWSIPAERMKMSRPHRIPLSSQALLILEYMKQIRNSDYIFSGNKPNRPPSNMVLLNLLDRMGFKHLTAHGFRSTFRDWVGETDACANDVAELALAHVIGNKAEAGGARGGRRP